MELPSGKSELGPTEVEYGDLNYTISENQHWSEADERKIRRKIDLHVVPMVFVLFLLCYVDRTNIGNARIQGITKDLKMHGYQFNWALTIFYVAYILVEIPSNILLRIFGGKYYLPGLVVAFGTVSFCTAFVHNYTGLMICRLFLGVAEGGVLPGIAYFLSTFYKRTELLFRLGIFIMGASMAGAFGGLFAAALTQVPPWGVSSMVIERWRNIFLFEGILSILVAFIGMAILPASPDTCHFLSKREQYVALERINREFRESADEKTRPHHVKEALLSPTGALCAAMFFFMNITVASFSLFLPTILKDLGWTSLKAQLLSVPPYVTACACAILSAWFSDKIKRRAVFVISGSLISLTGYAVLIATNKSSVKYAAVFIACAGSFPAAPTIIGWGLNNAAGPSVRSVTSAYIVAIGNCGAIVATWAYLPSDEPSYHRGHSLNLAAMGVCAMLATGTWVFVRRENSKRDAGVRNDRVQGLDDEQQRRLGSAHPDFRYVE